MPQINRKSPLNRLTKKQSKERLFLFSAYLASFLIIIGVVYLTFWVISNQETAEHTTDVVEAANLTEPSADQQTTSNPNSHEFDPYHDFHDVSYLEANFEELRKINPEIQAWISVSGTDINYPIAQHSDNSFYLTHSINQSNNNAGWVFMDYRNRPDFNNKNTIIYAHGREDGSMFGTLKQVLHKEWQSHPDNYSIKISTPQANSIWTIFSIYQIPDTNDYIQTDFEDNTEYSTFLDLLQSRSSFNFHNRISAKDQIITLSTCANSTSSEKIVVHAKLVSTQPR